MDKWCGRHERVVVEASERLEHDLLPEGQGAPVETAAPQ